MLTRQLTFFLVAGEESGDLHGSRLIRNIKQQHPEARFVGHGGDKLAAEGMEILEHVNDLSVMGFTEVIKRLPYMFGVMNQTQKKIETIQPDRIILIDYPGFNLRLAKNMHRLNIPITYFILPQVWAWKEKRIHTLRDYVDQALCIFPFEQKWFEEHGVPASFVGHPFSEPYSPDMDAETFYQKHGLDPNTPILVLLPGSRQQEIDRHWDIFLQTVDVLKEAIPNMQVIVGKAPTVKLNPAPDFLKVEADNPRLAMLYGSAALVASGTATLEAAVMDIPMIVCYRLSAPTWWLVKRVTHVPYAAMVNLIANRLLVPEFLQGKMTPGNLSTALLPLLSKTRKRKEMLQGFEEVRRTLGIPGVYERAAQAILQRTITG